jgi:hypothetical protein
MQSIVTNQILKHAAGTAMFCGLCNTSLDYKRCVLIEDTKCSRSTVICASCFKTVEPLQDAAMMEKNGIELTKGMEVN